ESGTPLVNDLFEKAEELANHPVLCYANCDILLRKDFLDAVQRISRWSSRFLMVGECWNLDVETALPFADRNWEAMLQDRVAKVGKPRGPFGIDYFVFSRGLYGRLPAFALGRSYFDNWLIWKVRSMGVPVVDATSEVIAIHQNHDYGHL